MPSTLLSLFQCLGRLRGESGSSPREAKEAKAAHIKDLLALTLQCIQNDTIEAGDTGALLAEAHVLLRQNTAWSWQVDPLDIPGLRGGSPVEAIEMGMLDRGLDPDIVPASKSAAAHWPLANLSGWRSRMDWAVDHRYLGVVQRLLWHPQAAAWYVAHCAFKPTGLTAPDELSENADGWAWMVRNAGMDIVTIFLSHGANANHFDLSGRPVIAYAPNNDIATLLLREGADPLSPHLPLTARRISLRMLWSGWKFFLSRDEMPDGLNYLLRRLRDWAEAERQEAAAELLLLMEDHWPPSHNNLPVRHAFAAIAGLRKNELPRWEDHTGHVWEWCHAENYRNLMGLPLADAAGATVETATIAPFVSGVDDALWSLIIQCTHDSGWPETVEHPINPEQSVVMAHAAMEHLIAHSLRKSTLLSALEPLSELGRDRKYLEYPQIPFSTLLEWYCLVMDYTWARDTPVFFPEAEKALASTWIKVAKDIPLFDRARAACYTIPSEGNIQPSEIDIMGEWIDEAIAQGWAPDRSQGLSKAINALSSTDPLRAATIEASLLSQNTQDASNSSTSTRTRL